MSRRPHSAPAADDGHWRRTVTPCVYPGCRDGDGNARLTTDVICPPSRRRYERVLRWLADDYATLHAELGQPTGPAGEHVTVSREYGHPAEHLSDLKREVVWKLGGWHNAVADHQGHTPAPEPSGHREARCVHLARNYLLAHFEVLCIFPGARAAAHELHTLHGRIRATLGQSHRAKPLPVPCPDCDMLAMVRTVGWDRSDSIECAACGYLINEQEYDLYARILAAQYTGCEP